MGSSPRPSCKLERDVAQSDALGEQLVWVAAAVAHELIAPPQLAGGPAVATRFGRACVSRQLG